MRLYDAVMRLYQPIPEIEYAWRCKEPRVVELDGHKRWVHGVHVKGCMMTSRSCYEGVKIWDLDTMECAHEVKGPQCIYSVALENERVFLGLGTGYVRVDLLGSNETFHSFHAHDDWVRVLFASDGRLISSDDSCLKIWDASTFACVQCISSEGWKSLCVHGKELLYGLLHGEQVRVFHQEEGWLYMLEIGNRVHSIRANSKHIIIGSAKGEIQVWSKESKEKMATLNGGRAMVLGVWCDERRLVSVSHQGCLKVWEMRSLTCIKIVSLGVQRIRCMDCDNGRVVVGTELGRVCVLDFIH